MDISYYIIYALLTNKVSGDFLSQQVVGVIGRSTILPCFSSDNGNKHTDINVRWRHNGTPSVCDITDGKCSREHQAAGYKNRTEVFPEEFVKGNFSLKLSNLTSTDAGEYQCFIIHSSELVKVQLHLNESTADKADTAANKEDTTANKGDPTTETRLMLQILLPLLSFVFLLLVCFIVFKYLKRRYKTCGSGVSAYGGHLSDNGSCQPLSNTPESANQNHKNFSGLQNNI
ncbi:butyrophilin subfamily 2 member A2-like [Paramisgurnus dabryanus]|uniref:butyrophilin subfamily 2 member A2-like n=1 Tax=Paramisgurnus dabryanus TaxID=90735 RepID=UPI0031F347E8